MDKPAIIILGAGIMQLPAFEAARRNNWFSIAADGNPAAPCRSRADKFLHIDLKDRTGLAHAAEELRDSHDIRGVFTCGTDFSSSVAWVADKLNLPGIPYQTALDCTDKYRMRKRFREHGVPCPDFREISEDMDPRKETRGLNYPLVVKPVDNMGGRGVITVESPEGLSEAVNEAIGYSRTGRAIIEEFMDGREYSIDALVYGGTITITGFADRHIYYPPCFIEMGHTLPSEADDQTREEIFRVFKDGVRALGIHHGAAKGDIKVTSRGVMIGEIAARLSGGYMSGWTFPYASGINLVEEGMRLAMGMAPGSLQPVLNNTSSERAFLSIPGVIKDISNLEEVHSMEHVRDIFLISDIGDTVAFPLNNVMKCGNVIAVAKNRNEAVEASNFGVSRIRILLESDNDDTLDFLSQPLETAFPPSAYRIELWKDLEKLKTFKPDFTMKYKESAVPVPGIAETDFLNQRDWNCLKLSDALDEIFEENRTEPTAGSSWTLYALHFWYALLRGGIQGATWYIRQNEEAL